MSLRSAIVSQFGKPRGIAGALAGWIMANRPSNRRRNRWTVSLLNCSPNGRVLEWGCGPGIGIEACLRACESARIVAVDHSPLMVRKARARNSAAVARGQALILEGDFSTAQAYAPFDIVFSCNVLQFAEDKAAALAQIREMLAPGGISASTFQPRTPKATAETALAWAKEIAELHRAAGFGPVSIEVLDLSPPAVCVLGRNGAS
jgi:trans-aconitate methyltransferase